MKKIPFSKKRKPHQLVMGAPDNLFGRAKPEKLSFKTLVLFEGRWEDGVANESPIPDLEQNDASAL